MSITFDGDTFASIARRVYGSETHAGVLAAANPGARPPFRAGETVVTPPLSGAAGPQPAQPAATQNEVAILIDGTRFRFWTSMRLTRAVDAVDTLELAAPFDPDAPGVRDTFRPFSFKSLTVLVGGVARFTGTLVGVTPSVGNDGKTLEISGYSVPGVLNDCTAPASAYPLEFNNMALPEIAAAIIKPFGLRAEFTAPGGAKFERAAAGASDTVLSFLTDLAQQRGLIISSTPDGALLFQQSARPGKPVATLRQGAAPVISVSPSFSPQQYYSHITGLESVALGSEGSQYTVKNPHLAGVIRPLTFQSPDVQGGDLPAAVAAKAARMFANMAAYSVQVSTWRDPSGALWAPNTTVVLQAPGAMVYKDYEFIVRGVRFEKTATAETAELDLVLPGAFESKLPEVLPWE